MDNAMENHDITMLKDLNITNNLESTIKVRVIRLWRNMNKTDQTRTYSIEMVLMDEEGTRVLCTRIFTWFARFDQFLREGVAFYLSKPTIANYQTKYKLIDCAQKIGFNYQAQIAPCNKIAVSLYGFVFVEFSDILDKSVSEIGTIDVIGFLTQCYDPETYVNALGEVKPKRNFELQDLDGNKISVTLWESYVGMLNEYMETHRDVKDVVIIVQFASMKWWSGKPRLGTAYNISRLIINDDIEEINHFKKSYLEKANMDSTSGLSTESIFYNIRDDFLVYTEFNKIAQVNVIAEVKSVVIVGSRKDVLADHSGPSGEGFKRTFICDSGMCKGLEITGVPRFKIPLNIQDSTGLISVTLFEGEAKKFLKLSAKQMFDRYMEGCYKTLVPDELHVLENMKCAFKIDITDYNIHNNYQLFRISKLTTDPKIITELESRFDDVEITRSAPVNVESVNLSSQDQSGDNATPISKVDNNKGKNPVNYVDNDSSDRTPFDLKRNLAEVYDVDDVGGHSASKTGVNNSSLSNKNGKFDLITPKSEK